MTNTVIQRHVQRAVWRSQGIDVLNMSAIWRSQGNDVTKYERHMALRVAKGLSVVTGKSVKHAPAFAVGFAQFSLSIFAFDLILFVDCRN